MEGILDQLAVLIYNDQFQDVISEPLIKHMAEQLWKAVTTGFGATLDELDFETPDYQMLQALRTHVWQFSAARNYAHLRELSAALLDETGQLRTFEQFRQAAGLINDRYMKQWLQTEYNLAVGGAQMASKWLDIQRNREALPLLEFVAVLDGQTTELCRGLDGTILPIDHPFWNNYYPPNHFNCRSTVKQLAFGKVSESIPSVDIPEMFRTNLGSRSLIFPPTHPFFIGVPADVLAKYTNP